MSVSKEHKPTIEHVTREGFFRDLRRVTLDGIAPTYILDPNFQFLDWNVSFENLVAKPLNLRLGMHAMSFVNQLENLDEVMKRVSKIFVNGQHPFCDCEPLRFRTESYGLVEFQKIATQILDEKGQKRAWTVTLNISRAEKWDALWEDISNWIGKEALWSGLSLSSQLFTCHHDFVRAVELLTKKIPDQTSCLELGATDSRLTLALTRKGCSSWIVEPSQVMAEMLQSQLSSVRKGLPISVVRGRVEQLDDYASQSFDTVVSLEGLSRLEDPKLAFGQVRRLLRASGHFHFLAHLKGKKGEFLDTIRQEAVSANLVQELDSLEKSLSLLGDSFRSYSAEELTRLLTEAGFKKIEISTTLFGGNVLLGSAS